MFTILSFSFIQYVAPSSVSYDTCYSTDLKVCLQLFADHQRLLSEQPYSDLHCFFRREMREGETLHSCRLILNISAVFFSVTLNMTIKIILMLDNLFYYCYVIVYQVYQLVPDTPLWETTILFLWWRVLVVIGGLTGNSPRSDKRGAWTLWPWRYSTCTQFQTSN